MANFACVAIPATDGKDVAAPIKSLTGDETETAPAGGILASLASAVGLGGAAATTDTSTHEHQQLGAKSVSDHIGHDTAGQPHSEGALSNGIHEQDPATTNSGLQFVEGTSTMNPATSQINGQQSHSAISQSVNEGALETKDDPAHSNNGLAFICKSCSAFMPRIIYSQSLVASPEKQQPSQPTVNAVTSDTSHKQSSESAVPNTSTSAPLAGTSGAYTIGQPLGTKQNGNVESISSGLPASTDSIGTTTNETPYAQHKAVEPSSASATTEAKNATTIESSPTPKDPSNLR